MTTTNAKIGFGALALVVVGGAAFWGMSRGDEWAGASVEQLRFDYYEMCGRGEPAPADEPCPEFATKVYRCMLEHEVCDYQPTGPCNEVQTDWTTCTRCRLVGRYSKEVKPDCEPYVKTD